MEEETKVEKFISTLKQYTETRIDIIILNLQDKVSEVLSSFVSGFIIALLTFMVIVFASLGFAWWIGQHYENYLIGFFAVAGIYLIVVAIVYLNRDNWIKGPVINALLKKITIHEED
ncbi:hypothetical protein BH11BAC2_BH11BAC2_10990 [soil metagenome]